MKLPRMDRGFGPGTSLKPFSAEAAEQGQLRTSRFAAAGEDGGAVSFELV